MPVRDVKDLVAPDLSPQVAPRRRLEGLPEPVIVAAARTPVRPRIPDGSAAGAV